VLLRCLLSLVKILIIFYFFYFFHYLSFGNINMMIMWYLVVQLIFIHILTLQRDWVVSSWKTTAGDAVLISTLHFIILLYKVLFTIQIKGYDWTGWKINWRGSPLKPNHWRLWLIWFMSRVHIQSSVLKKNIAHLAWVYRL
jgi:hypothetical protein